ncbi:MAG: hypothetical protein AB1696_11255 [Planctomycetota bacterium]
MTDFQGKLYCPNCIAKISKEKDKPRGQAAVEVAGGGPVEQKSPALLKLLVILGFIALTVGVAFSVYYIVTQKPPLPPPVKIEDTVTGVDGAPLSVTPANPVKEFPFIEVPVSKGERVFRCPVCQQECPFSGPQEQSCLECGRKLLPVIARDFPDVKYVAKDGDVAVLQLGDKELRAKLGEEIMPGSGIKIERFTELGLMLAKTETIKYVNHREEGAGEQTREVIVHTEIPKFREGGSIPVEVMRGTKSLTCDGKWKNRVYHKDPIIMPLKYMEPGAHTVPCANQDCWNVFEVTVKDFPEIRIPITKLSDKVNCLQCGAERYLVPRGRPEVFQCTGCDRQIALYLWTVKDVSFLRKEGDQAVIRHKGAQIRVKIGQELAPGSGVKIEEIGQGDGGEFLRVSANVNVEYEEFEDGKGIKKSKVISLQDQIGKVEE